MKTQFKLGLLASTIALMLPAQAADSFADALTSGKATANFNLRYESVEQDNAKKDADALTLRTRLNYTTADVNGWSAALELEDARALMDDYNDTLGEGTEYSVIADPEHTELDQGYVQYKNKKLTAKFGRQVLTLDNHRFVGHVGWRQDRQTFDALSLAYQFDKNTQVKYAYINKRNRIFSDERDIDAKDHLLNLSHKSDIGNFTGYAYMLEQDNSNIDHDTYGIRYNHKIGQVAVTAEFAQQDVADFSANYLLLEAGTQLGAVNVKAGYELLGSDDGDYGFSTPLATAHKFNGWSDQFLATPAQGLVDLYVSVGGKLAGGKWALIAHDYSADESTSAVDDLGNEFNALYVKPFNKQYKVGIKYAAYSAGDSGAGKVDTDKLWLWGEFKF
ncbi:hypothetical protein tinsulaeT_07560 [Thalassotalea insulae]|uniref:Alginate export domain-containing protein n=1 Tax=Thalassotalea insulae TaxID=2056778 RepID=A0ABQ6GRU6_9GAMM|nr:alginate export family protein [Thalassotalea insulae]GLX77416.1 hypothetical protein tinsulaeT_07560 [Thalassotalea insulae]